MFGRYFCDHTQARENGMPPSVLGRESPMSDKHQALFSNVFFFVSDVVSWLSFPFFFNVFFVHVRMGNGTKLFAQWW